MSENTPIARRSRIDEYVDDLPADVDEAAVARMRAVARLLDESVRVPGTDYRIGVDPLLGVVPGAGDGLSGALSLYIIVEAAQQGVSTWTVLRMLGNVAVDVGVGSLPLVGDLFDVAWKANKRNLELALADLAAGRSGGTDRGDDEIDITVE
jgi:hypothetical protein